MYQMQTVYLRIVLKYERRESERHEETYNHVLPVDYKAKFFHEASCEFSCESKHAINALFKSRFTLIPK